MEPVAGWLFRRMRRRYVYVIVTCAVALLGPGLLVPTVGVGCLFLRQPAGVYWQTLGATAFTMLVVAAITTVASNGTVRPVHDWLAGRSPDPMEVWRTLRDMPNRYVKQVYGTTVTAVILVGITTFGRSSGATAPTLLVCALIACGTGALGGVILSVGVELGIRPIAEEVSASMPLTHELGGATWSVRMRIVLGAATVAYATGLLTTSIVVQVDDADTQLLVALAGTLLGGAIATAVFHVGVSQPLLRPLRDLLEGTRRVRLGDFSSPLPVTTSDELGQLAQSFNAMQAGLQERAALHAAFGTYVDPGLTQRLLDLGDDAFAAEALEVTVCFIDVQGFTAFASSVSPEEAVERLNQLFQLVVPIVRECGGHANRFLGDGLLAVFGAPDPLEGHADRAVACALQVQRAVCERFGRSLRIGLGLNTGAVIAGAIGGGGKLEYTVVGDVVNVASRVEQLTREVGDPILITAATADALTRRVRLVDVGRHTVRGKADPVHLHAVVPCQPRTRVRRATGSGAGGPRSPKPPKGPRPPVGPDRAVLAPALGAVGVG